MGVLHAAFSLPIAAGAVLAQAAVAEGVLLTFSGRVYLYEPVTAAAATGDETPDPVSAAQVTVTFHGHEAGITEYTTERTTRVVTDENGYFDVAIKLSEYRYRWTHATLAVEATDVSKATTLIATVYNDGRGGTQGTKDVRVMPQ